MHSPCADGLHCCLCCNLYVAGTRVTSENASDILGDGVASYDASSNTLTISGNITAPDDNTPCIDNSIHNLTINVASAATLTAYEKTIKIQGITTIIGSAKLTVNETKPIINGTEELPAIYAVVNNLNISNANLDVNGDFYCSGDLKITNSTLSTTTVTITQGSIMGYKSLTLTDCYLKTPQGGYYDSTYKKLVNAKGAGVSGVEIVATGKPTGVEDIFVTPSDETRKILHNGTLFILRGNKTYTLTGQEVK